MGYTDTLKKLDYVRNLWDTLEEVHEHAREHLQATQKCQKDHYDQGIAGEQIEDGDRVFLHDLAVKKGQTKKLHSQCKDLAKASGAS